MRKVLVVGATSAIAQETMKLFAGDGDSLFLVGRDQKKLEAVADDLRVRGSQRVEVLPFDLNNFDGHQRMLLAATESLGNIDTVLVAHGTLPDQPLCQTSSDETLRALQTNCLSAILLLTHIANQFERQRNGTIAVISSVAGDRGRQSNYVYGTAKAAITIFLQGLRNRLHPVGVHVLTVKPGFVDTPMTADFTKGLLWTRPETVGRKIYRAIERQRNVVYIPWFWRWIMLIIKSVPEVLFKKLKL